MQLHEELQLLARATEGDTFHYAVVQWNHFSLIKQAQKFLRQQYPERPALSLVVKGQTYESLTEQIYRQGNGFIFIEDFENLLDNPDLYIAFNQRRGKFARLPLSIIGFIPSGKRFVEMCVKRLPDWWSVLTILAELNVENVGAEKHTAFQEPSKISTLGGSHNQERLEEIQNLQKRISQLEATPENAKRIDGLYRQLLEICETAGLYQLGLDIANEWLKVAFALDYENTAADSYSLIFDRIGTFEQYLGHYDRAARLREKALEIYLKNFGKEHLNVAALLSNLASVYSDLGDYERARNLLEQALASDLKNFGEIHPNVALSQFNLINTYRSLGQYERARDLLEEMLTSVMKNFGINHPSVAAVQSELAGVYKNLGQYERARDLLEIALASDLKNFRKDHPNVAVSQSNLAIIYSDLGDYERARDLLEAALASDLKNFGKDHPNVAVSQINLGVVFLKLGEKEKAKVLFQQAYQLRQRILGEQHPKTQTAKEWLDKVS